jgi:N-acetyl-gamma-glutamyl-phosphate reductase
MKVGIVGASGFAGIELTRIFLSHGSASLEFVTSDRWEHSTIASRTRLPSQMPYVSVTEGLALAHRCTCVFLATPASVSLELVPKLRAKNIRVVDLSGSFRLQDELQYPHFYNFTHTAVKELREAAYGIPELFRSHVVNKQFVANPGCYATAAALSAAPLLRTKLIYPESLVINAASGVSGAGRKATEDFSFMEVDNDFKAYRTLKHQHLPEIEQTLSWVASQPISLVFTPHLLPLKRGILCTTVARTKPGITQEQIREAFQDAYREERLLSFVGSPDEVRIADVVGTPLTQLGFATDGKHVVSIAAIDNLLKGAASQAVQNFNLMLQLPETQGLL